MNSLVHKGSKVLVSAMVIGSIIAPSVSAFDIVDFDSIYSKTITKKKIRNYLDSASEVKSSRSMVNFNIEYDYKYEFDDMLIEDEEFQSTTPDPVVINGRMDMDASGITNYLVEGDEKFQVHVDANVASDGKDYDISTEFRYVGGVLYGLIDPIPQEVLDSSPEYNQINGQWFAYQSPELEEMMKSIRASNNGTYQGELEDQDLDKFIALISSREFTKNMTKKSYTAMDGAQAECVNFKWSHNELEDLADKASTIWPSDSITTDTSSDDTTTVNGTELEFCMGEDFTKLYKVFFKTSVKSDTGYMNVEFNQDMYDFNVDLPVEAPGSFVNLSDVFPTTVDEYESTADAYIDMTGVTPDEGCTDIGGDDFPDVTRNFENYDAIKYAKQNSLVNGYSDGCFRSWKGITRAELIKIAVRSNDSEGEITGCVEQKYSDIGTYDKFVNEVCLATNKGYINGYSDGTMRGDQLVTFGEASKMISNINGLTIDPNDTAENVFKPYIKALEERKAIPESVYRIDSTMNRGSSTEILYRLSGNITNKPSRTFEDVNR